MRNTRRRRQRGPGAAPIDRPEPADRSGPVPARDRRTWLVVIPLRPARGRRVLPRAWTTTSSTGTTTPISSRIPITAAWAGPRCDGPGPPSRGRLSAAGLDDPRGAIRPLRAGPPGISPDQPASARRRCGRALCPDLGAARPLSARPVPRASLGAAVGAGLASAMFAVHPLRDEAVAWVSCQPYLPCTLFSMLAVLAYLRAVGDRGPRRVGDGWRARSCCSSRRCCRRRRRWACPRCW